MLSLLRRPRCRRAHRQRTAGAPASVARRRSVRAARVPGRRARAGRSDERRDLPTQACVRSPPGTVLGSSACARRGCTAAARRSGRAKSPTWRTSRLVTGFAWAWLAALATLCASALALRRAGPRSARSRAGCAGLEADAGGDRRLGLLMLVDFEAFFDSFHGVFFSADTWRFNDGDTLLCLYPDTFWASPQARRRRS